MTNVRPMTADEVSSEKVEEYMAKRSMYLQIKQELAEDPEGAFGGRGNNAPTQIRKMEGELAALESEGYSLLTVRFRTLIESGIRFEAVTGVSQVAVGKNKDKWAVSAVEGKGRKVEGSSRERYWLLDDPEIPADILAEANSILELEPEGFKVPFVTI